MKNIQITVSTILAFIAVALVVRAVGVDPSMANPAAIPETLPTPYSAAHAEVQSRPGTAEELPPTF